jgi:S-adenosylmethionine:tRNA ribosyltransferase-isomerase
MIAGSVCSAVASDLQLNSFRLAPISKQGDKPFVLTSDFHFSLPDELIAQTPAPHRDSSRLLVVDRKAESISHHTFSDLPAFLNQGDLLILNNSKVIPARLWARKKAVPGRIEILLLEENSTNDWWAMLRPAKKVPIGTDVHLLDHSEWLSDISATVLEKNEQGYRRLRFNGCTDIQNELARFGETPLPPYIHRDTAQSQSQDLERYQTIYSKPPGSVAAPTAGLHFTSELLATIRARGVTVAEVTLHVGPGTFVPVKTSRIEDHNMHEERYHFPQSTAALINETKVRGGRIVAVGTTTLRVLESIARAQTGALAEASGRTSIFIYPPAEFNIVDALLTNFHLPESTLLMLVSAFAKPGRTEGREFMLQVYQEAIARKYRFFSYGDAMLLL